MYFSVLKLCCFFFGILMGPMCFISIDLFTVVITGVMAFGPSLDTLHCTRPTSSLTGPITLASLAGVQLLNIVFYVIQLFMLGDTEGFIPFPSDITTSWYYLGDNWQCTVIFVTAIFPLLTCAATFSFGGVHRKPVWSNIRLTLTLGLGFVFASLLLLLPSNPLSRVFHIASEDLNSPCPAKCYEAYLQNHPEVTVTSPSDFVYTLPGCSTCPTSPVWLVYQVPQALGGHGGLPSPAMSFEVRLRIWLVAMVECALLVIWEKVGVMGPVANLLKAAYPRSVRLQL